jgi:signal recognition particle receptor subunit beta
MAVILVGEREAQVKIVVWGPGGSGKTTTLAWLHAALPEELRGPLVQIDGPDRRTLFFDAFPLGLEDVGGYTIRVFFSTVPGQPGYAATRRALLRGVDGLLFVADRAPDAGEANAASLAELRSALADVGRDPDRVPLVVALNKSDLPDALPAAAVVATLDAGDAPVVVTTATAGAGVLEAISALTRRVVREI